MVDFAAMLPLKPNAPAAAVFGAQNSEGAANGGFQDMLKARVAKADPAANRATANGNLPEGGKILPDAASDTAATADAAATNADAPLADETTPLSGAADAALINPAMTLLLAQNPGAVALPASAAPAAAASNPASTAVITTSAQSEQAPAQILMVQQQAGVPQDLALTSTNGLPALAASVTVRPLVASAKGRAADAPATATATDAPAAAAAAPSMPAALELARRSADSAVAGTDAMAAPLATPLVATASQTAGGDIPLAGAAAAPRAEQPLDFAALVDRLVQAREAAAPQTTHAAVTHAEFGQVALQFRQDTDGLTVTMASADPAFARAAQAAIPAAQAAAAAGDDAARQDGQATAQGQNGNAAATGGNSSQMRGGSGQSRDAGADRQTRANPSGQNASDDSRAAARSGIFA